MHAHGPGRLQRGTRRGGFDRAPFHGHDRRRQVAAAAGPRLAARHRRGRAHPRAGERARLLLRPQSRRHAAPEGFRRPDLRPHRAQGRPDRHRDHQPARRAGVGARHRPARGASRGRAGAFARRRTSVRRAVHRHAHGRIRLRPRARSRARDRRRADDVPLSHAVGRQVLRRTRDGAALRGSRCATWRWCSSIRRGCWPARIRG